jgi:hypothetical protein
LASIERRSWHRHRRRSFLWRNSKSENIKDQAVPTAHDAAAELAEIRFPRLILDDELAVDMDVAPE